MEALSNQLQVLNLLVAVNGKLIIKDVSLKVKRGEILVIMGPNGSGKTTLAYAIMGHPNYQIINGKIILDGEDITNLPTEERSLRGLYLAFQNPVEVKGIRLSTLLIAAINKREGAKNLTKITDANLLANLMKEANEVGLKPEALYRDINVGFSGGEKKRSEIIQALLLKPKYIILDEPDSGLDIDGVKIIAEKISKMVHENNVGVIIITHYARLLKYIKPNRIIVMKNGRILKVGDYKIAYEVEEKGYEGILGE